jgi:hypothetical protein
MSYCYGFALLPNRRFAKPPTSCFEPSFALLLNRRFAKLLYRQRDCPFVSHPLFLREMPTDMTHRLLIPPANWGRMINCKRTIKRD